MPQIFKTGVSVIEQIRVLIEAVVAERWHEVFGQFPSAVALQRGADRVTSWLSNAR
jgi:hypothetical protein